MKRSELRVLGLLTQIGLIVVIAMLISAFLGYHLDQFLGTRVIFTLVFIVIGSAAGFRSAYQLITEFFSDDRKNGNE